MVCFLYYYFIIIYSCNDGVTHLECDPSQCEFSPPGCLTLHTTKSPLLGMLLHTLSKKFIIISVFSYLDVVLHVGVLFWSYSLIGYTIVVGVLFWSYSLIGYTIVVGVLFWSYSLIVYTIVVGVLFWSYSLIRYTIVLLFDRQSWESFCTMYSSAISR